EADVLNRVGNPRTSGACGGLAARPYSPHRSTPGPSPCRRFPAGRNSASARRWQERLPIAIVECHIDLLFFAVFLSDCSGAFRAAVTAKNAQESCYPGTVNTKRSNCRDRASGLVLSLSCGFRLTVVLHMRGRLK